MATGFSVFVNIGGKVSPSLNAAVSAAKAQVNGLGASLAGMAQRMNAPFMAVNKHLAQTSKRMAAVQRTGRNATFGVTMPTGLLAVNALKAANDRAKAGNTLEAVGLDGMTPEERTKARKDIVAYADSIAAKYGDATEIMKTFNELLKAGFDVKAAKGAIETVMQGAATAEDMSGADLGGYVTKLATQYKLGMKSTEDAAASTQRIVDNLVYGALKTSASTKDMAQSFRYVGAAAAAAGQSVESTNATIIAMAKAGILNSESGVALRSAYVRLIKPTKGGRAAMARLGLNYSDYVNQGNRTGEGISAGLSASGYDLDAARVNKALKANEGSPEKQRKAIYDAVVAKLGTNSAQDMSAIMEAVDDAYAVSGNEVDLIKLARDLKKKGATQGDLANIFEGRQSVRMLALLSQDLDGILKDVQDNVKGYAQKTWEVSYQGLPKAILELDASYKGLRNTLVELVMPDILGGMKWLEGIMKDMAGSSPGLLKTGVYLGAAAAATGPLLYVLGSIGRVAMFSLRLLNGALMAALIPVRLLVGGIALLAGRLVALGVAAIAVGARMRVAIAAMAMLRWSTMALAGVAVLGGGLRALGAAVLAFPVAALRGIGLAMWAIVANPVGLIITALVAALTALGVWVHNNWDGLKSFFAGFGEGFLRELGPAGDGVKRLADRLGSVSDWLGKLLGPLDESGKKWNEWGKAVGGAAAEGVNKVILAIETLVTWVGTAIEKISKLGSAIKGVFSGAYGNGIEGGAPSPPVAGARALGGPVSYGKPYLVGERGPELFVPGASGRIETNGMLRRLNASGAEAVAGSSSSAGGMVSRSQRAEINITVNGGNPADVRKAAEDAVYAAFARLETEQRGLLSD
ncbi:phage tail tape measure protein [Bradyrhizobium sp. SZCCHNR1004]|uniref:phage tail tape measure protein n=1 Tax=Bradyrhizobium sp. SZCCHNR1004 TaxID=3057335 RepID=UPI0029165163|nr:phage tail tape measure protein [Bradyrhizobium sp. SZCCHNR1004]